MPSNQESFECVYCGRSHPINLNSDEHIIPKAFKNKGYTLPDACQRLNNYMANSFEKRVKDFEISKELLLLIDPPKKPVFRGEVETPLNKDVFRYILPSGKNELTEHPQYSSTNQIEVKIKDSTGNYLPFLLTLPFAVMNGVTGTDRMVAGRGEDVEKVKQRVTEYLQKLVIDSNLNEDLDKYLKKVGGTFSFREILIAETATPNPKMTQQIHAEQYFNFDTELLMKFFMKIAWTHAVKQLGVDKLRNPVGNWIINYLTTGHVEEPDLIDYFPTLFTVPVVIEGQEYIFWSYGAEQTQIFIEDIEDEKIYGKFLKANHTRLKQLGIAKSLISLKTNFDGQVDKLFSRKDELRFHNLKLKTIPYSGKKVTACCIQLFGSFFYATVILSETPLAEIYPDDIRIDF